MTTLEFEHKPAAHCENGVIANMFRYYGFDTISEPMIFGLASGLFFGHIPFVKMWDMPFTTFRTFSGVLFKRVTRLLGFKTKTKRFLFNQERAMQELDEVLHSGTPVGCVTSMYYLTYLPPEFRYHFNGHNLCVIGKEGDSYIISDPITIEKVTILEKDLIRSRFAKGGVFPSVGKMYWITSVPDKLPDLAPLVRKAIKHNCWLMTSQPKWIPYFGVNGIYYLSKQIRTWEQKMGKKKAALNLAQIIRMLEEIGTGGAGFRYMYAAFLQQAASITDIAELNVFSQRLTEIGDLWRSFAYKTARVFKERQGEQYTFDDLGDILYQIAELEAVFFKELKTAV